MKLLVVNCGSSSIKYQLFEMPQSAVLAKGLVERIGEQRSAFEHQVGDQTWCEELPVPDHDAGMTLILKSLVEGSHKVLAEMREIAAVGHRVVHGGEDFSGSVLIDEQVIATIERVADLAPLHNPPNLTGIRAARAVLPEIPQVACFDTAFHSTIPLTAFLYGLPYDLYKRYGIRRYGFHGASHLYVARRAAAMLQSPLDHLNCITCHLGNGCSMTAVRGGKSVDTSMGMTPLEGLVMGTRGGDFDPAILLYLMEKGYDVESLNRLCNRESGLLGISGLSNDVRVLSKQASLGHERAQLAMDIFCQRVKKYIGAYSAVLGTVAALVFTGGIGENSAEIRAGCCSQLDQLGIQIDPRRNAEVHGAEAEIQADHSRVRVLVIPTDEEGVIARDTYELTKGLC